MIATVGRVRSKHSKKEVEAALRYAEQMGLTVESTTAGHKWGRIICGDGHRFAVWSTPRSPGNHARDLMRWADRHRGHEREESE